MKKVVIVSAARTPIGSFGGVLSSLSATQLGAEAIKGAIKKADIPNKKVDEVIMGCVLQANVGQAPARQASKFAGLPDSVVATTINKVCASGMKSIMYAAQSIALGDADIIVAGGMESMSNVPHYAVNNRWGKKFGDSVLLDGMSKDGLQDVYNQYPMGCAAEVCAREHKFSREEQDEFAINSYKKSQAAIKSNLFAEEIVPISIPQRKGDPKVIYKDEEPLNVKFEKISQLRPAFQKDGSVTAANASTINDGAAALVLMSAEKAKELNITPMATLVSYADAEQSPEWFTTAPSLALPKACKKANIDIQELDAIELNEAFSVVGLANTKILNLDSNKVNINGGAVSLGHPLGCSGARIVVTLLHILKQKQGNLGGAGICNGGGGASALIIKNLL